ncbi:hypothetical protein [Kitasatospora terrestris]|uniref:Uncharacterized protein n=1 Tax=Kitasatospora terrestris TaxID=258051 RepID=A0ABP9DEU1_9ACTN
MRSWAYAASALPYASYRARPGRRDWVTFAAGYSGPAAFRWGTPMAEPFVLPDFYLPHPARLNSRRACSRPAHRAAAFALPEARGLGTSDARIGAELAARAAAVVAR